MQTHTARIVREGLSFGESPRWHEGRLWYSDFYRHGIYSMDVAGDEQLEHFVLTQPSGLGWLPGADLLCVSMTDYKVLRFSGAHAFEFCDISDYCGFWANDMVTSASGVSYVGNFGFDLDVMLRDQTLPTPSPTTNLVVISPEGDVLQVVPDLSFPNGTVITPDGATLIVGETMTCRLSAFDIESDGTLSNRRVWAQMDSVYTDGMCLDDDGQIWLANAIAPQCLRVKQGGEITGVVTTTQPSFACMLGGEDRRSLYVMTAPTSSRFRVAGELLGRIEVAKVAVPGAGLP